MNEQEDFEQYERLESYLNGALAPDDRVALEAALQTDKGLALELQLMQLHRQAGRELMEDDLQLKIQQWQLEKQKNGRNRWLLGGLALLLAALAFFWVVNPFSNKDTGGVPAGQEQEPGQTTPPPTASQPVAGAEAEAPAGPPDYLAVADRLALHPGDNEDVQLRGATGSDPLKAGLEVYQKHQYQKAIDIWSKVPPESEDWGYALLYSATAHLKLAAAAKEPHTAHLEKCQALSRALLQDRDFELIHPEARWTLLLALLAGEGPDSREFKEVRREINAKQPRWKEKVTVLEETLKKTPAANR